MHFIYNSLSIKTLNRNPDSAVNMYQSPYLFNGKELDEETSLYYYGARYMQPILSMWLSPDPMADKYPGVNPYTYCLQNPVKFIDPDGREIAN